MPTMPMDRRRMLIALALATPPLTVQAQTASPQQAGLLVASPQGARLDRWAEPIAAAVGRGLPFHAPLPRHNLGGLDGVTGANRFEARAEPDGMTALLVPGAATLSWLVGETRATFDPARWLLLWATAAPAVLVSRVLPKAGAGLQVAAAGPAGPELPMLMALDLLGVRVTLGSVQDANAILLQGPGLAAAVQAAGAQGMVPVLTLGLAGEDGRTGRDPLFPAVPTILEVTRNRASPDLAAALSAACAAVQFEAGLILPQLTPADAVATWRRACLPLLRDPDILAEAGRLGTRLLSAGPATDMIGRLAGSPAVLLSLREWLAARYGWRAA